MVRIQVKHGDTNQNEFLFLYDCVVTSYIDEIAHEIIQISNLQLKINRLAIELDHRLLPSRANPKAALLIRSLSEAGKYASKDQVMHNKPISYYVLRDHMQAIERQVMEHYELLGFQDSNQFNQLLTGIEFLQEETALLCWARKELRRDKRLCDYIGNNDKTKIMLRLQSSSSTSALVSEQNAGT